MHPYRPAPEPHAPPPMPWWWWVLLGALAMAAAAHVTELALGPELGGVHRSHHDDDHHERHLP